MLIVPAEHPLDWKRPPIVTLLLIALNVLIYIGYQGGDSERQAAAVTAYLDGGLLNRERALFLESFSAEHQLDPEEQKAVAALRRADLAALVLRDLRFEHRLHHNPTYQADAQWQAARQVAEAARDRISSQRFGFIPAQFSMQGLFGAMFLHGSFEHLLGNMIFLFIFGFALEIALGRWVYLGLYLASGVASHLLWWVMDPVWIAGIGASGAIAGLMGMYLALYGLRRINFFYWLGPLFGYLRAPALWILPIWIGKELYGLLLADDNTNYYAHLGGLCAGFLLVAALRHGTRLRVDDAYLNKQDPQAPFKRELAALDRLIEDFALEQAATRGLAMLQRYPQRLTLLERLYAVAKSRQDPALMSALLKQFFALPAQPDKQPLLSRLADDSSEQRLLQHPAVQLHLLSGLLRVADDQRAVAAWRRLSQMAVRPAQLPALTLQLAKRLGLRADVRGVGELGTFLAQAYPQAEQTAQLALYRQHLLRG